MIPPPIASGNVPRHPRCGGFTLVEILTATAVLAVLLALMLQIVNGILQSTKIQNQQMESVSSLRRVLDVLSQDIQNAVVGEDVSVLVSTNNADGSLLALLAARHGTNGGTDHRFLAVDYATNTASELYRRYASVPFATASLLSAVTNATNAPYPLAVGILGIQIRAVTESTNLPATADPSPNWATNLYNSNPVPQGYAALITAKPDFAAGMTNRARALEVWIAGVDDQNYRLLASRGVLDTASGLLSSTNHPSSWRASIDAAVLPAPAKSAVRILTKTIPLP